VPSAFEVSVAAAKAAATLSSVIVRFMSSSFAL
jgi:hypothetical protein